MWGNLKVSHKSIKEVTSKLFSQKASWTTLKIYVKISEIKKLQEDTV